MVLSDRDIRAEIERGRIGIDPFDPKCIQPASLDLRLDEKAYRIRCSFLPDRAAVTRFRLEVAGRVVEGVLKERGAARQEYDRALPERMKQTLY